MLRVMGFDPNGIAAWSAYRPRFTVNADIVALTLCAMYAALQGKRI
jgi:hypothetical protein